MKRAVVLLRGIKTGILTEDEHGYTFEYDTDYLMSDKLEAVSLTLPLSDKPYRDKVLFPFFDGLIPEELALALNGKKRKIKKTDFIASMQSSGLDEKVIENIFRKFLKINDKWSEFIDCSFLPNDMKEGFKGIIAEKLSRLSS